MSYGVSVLGVSVQGVSVRGVYVLGVSVRGVHVRGGYVLKPVELLYHTYYEMKYFSLFNVKFCFDKTVNTNYEFEIFFFIFIVEHRLLTYYLHYGPDISCASS